MSKGIFSVQHKKLVLAMSARQDETVRRLRDDSAVETWPADKSLKWHVRICA